MMHNFDYEYNFEKDIKKYFDYVSDTINDIEKIKEMHDIYKQYHLSLWNFYMDYKITKFDDEIIVFQNNRYCLTLVSTIGIIPESYKPAYYCYFSNNNDNKRVITNGWQNQQNMKRDDFMKDLVKFFSKFT